MDGRGLRKKDAMKMALYNLRDQLLAAWRMQQLIPGYFALLPFMIQQGSDLTLTEAWLESENLQHLLPSVTSGTEDEDVIEGDFEEK